MKAWNYLVDVDPTSFHYFQGRIGRCSGCRKLVVSVKAYINENDECFLAERNLRSTIEYGTKINYLNKVPRNNTGKYEDPHFCTGAAMESIGFSNFAKKHSKKESGNSFSTCHDWEIIDLILDNWASRTPGNGEKDLTRKVLVPIEKRINQFFCPSTVKLTAGMNVKSKVFTRQNGEDPYIMNYVTPDEAEKFGFKLIPAKNVKIVLYSADALLENNGTRSCEADWEVVTILCDEGTFEPMAPLTMARNFLEMPGGSKGVYSAQEFAESIYYHSKKNISVIDESYFEN